MSLCFDPSLPVINLGSMQMRLFEKNVLIFTISALQTQCPALGGFFLSLQVTFNRSFEQVSVLSIAN